jgi:hypothetical protein
MLHGVLSRALATDAAAEAAMKAKRAPASPDEDEDGEGRHARGSDSSCLALVAALSQLMLASKGSGKKSPDTAAGGSEDGSGERMLGWRGGSSIAARVPSSPPSPGGLALPPLPQTARALLMS